MFKSSQGQSAIEYLMTYGWMLLVVAVAGGTIFSATGDQKVKSVSGFLGSDVAIDNFGTNNNEELDLILRNTAANSIEINSINVSDGTSYTEWKGKRDISVGDTSFITLANVMEGSSTNKLDVAVSYNTGELESLQASGTISGRLELTENSSSINEGENASENFQVSIDSENSPVTENENFNVNYTIENTGDMNATQEIRLLVNGTEEDSESVSLNASQVYSGMLAWATEIGDAGNDIEYEVSSFNSSENGAVTVEAAEGPIAQASANVTVVEINDSVEFNASDSAEGDSNITSYAWNFGDGNSENGETVTHSYSSSGNYTVQLEVEDGNGLADTDTVDIEVQESASTSVLFDGSDSWEILQGSPTVDSTNAEMLDLRTSTDGDDNMVSFYYTDETATFSLEYTQTQAPPLESTVDRYYSIIDFRRGDGNSLFDVNVVGSNNIYVYDPTGTNQDYDDKRDKNYNTGISASGTHTIEMTWDGSAWKLNIDEGAYTRTMEGMNEPVDRVLFGGQGTSDSYLDGTHMYDVVDLTK